jgi:hypothetical protein
MMQQYDTREAAEAVCERFNSAAISETLEGNSQFLLSAEVIEDDGAYRISGRAIPTPNTPTRGEFFSPSFGHQS